MFGTFVPKCNRRGFRRTTLALAVLAATSVPPGCAEENAAKESLGTTNVLPAAPPAVQAAERAKLDEKQDAKAPPVQPRKIVYNANVTLVVQNVTTLGEKLESLVKEAGGYVSETDVSAYSQSQRRATWKLRIPVDRFEGFMKTLAGLGEMQQSRVDSQDVTQEYYDIEARVSNKKEEEKRLLKHLADSTGKLEDILAVERELTRVRGEVEQMQGRIRYLSNVSALSTVSVKATEVHDYVPPVAPTFIAQISRTFEQSLGRLTDFLKDIVLVVVAVVPWLPILLLFAVMALVMYRLVRRSLFAAPVRLEPMPPERPRG